MTIATKTQIVLTHQEVAIALSRYAATEGRLAAPGRLDSAYLLIPADGPAGGNVVDHVALDVRDSDGARLVFVDGSL